MSIDELIERSHKIAVEKGWWPEGQQRSVVEQVNNFHAEISEAWEEYRSGRMEVWYSDQYFGDSSEPLRKKPEGFWVEIADLCIRLADTMGAYGWTYRDLRPSDYARLDKLDWDLPRFIATLQVCVGCLGIDENGDIGGGWERNTQRTASGCLHLCMLAARHHGVDLLSLCELKMSYNATRPHRHGGKRA